MKKSELKEIIIECIEELEEASGATNMECMECGNKFKKKITSSTVDVKCPKCKGYDTEVA